MSKRNEWLNDNETVIYQSFVDYWVTYKKIIIKKYPEIHKEINGIVNDILNNKKVISKMKCMKCEKLYICNDKKCSNWEQRLKIQKQWDDDFLLDYKNEMFWEQQRR